MKYILLVLFSFFSLASQLNVKLSSDEISMEDSFQLSISFEHNGDIEPYVSFKPRNAEIISDNTNDSSRLTVKGHFAGGKMTQTKIYNYQYTLKPTRPGTIVIQKILVDLGSKSLKHRSLQVKVTRQRKKLQRYFVKAEVDKNEAYIGEKINLAYYIYFKGNITNPEFVKFPVQKNFLKRFELPRTNVERISIQGEVYKRLLLYKSVLYPEKVGDITIDPIEIRIQYPDQRTSQRNAFGMSLSFSSSTYKTKVLRSKRVKIKSKAIPTKEMPASFTGLVGDHDFKLTINKNKIVVNDVLEARLLIEGDGALEKIDPPVLVSSDSFEVFEARSEMIEKSKLLKNKTIDYTLLAKSAASIPEQEIEFSTFDPDTLQFKKSFVKVPALLIMGSGSQSTQITSKDVDNIKTEEREREIVIVSDVTNIMAPVFTPVKKYTTRDIAYILFSLIVLVLFTTSIPSLSNISFSSFRGLKKDFTYSNIYSTLMGKETTGISVSQRLDSLDLSDESKKYFIGLIENSSKNEYKGAKLPIKFIKKHWVELERAKNESNKTT